MQTRLLFKLLMLYFLLLGEITAMFSLLGDTRSSYHRKLRRLGRMDDGCGLLGCKHGVCDQKLKTCVCHHGWKGSKCDEKALDTAVPDIAGIHTRNAIIGLSKVQKLFSPAFVDFLKSILLRQVISQSLNSNNQQRGLTDVDGNSSEKSLLEKKVVDYSATVIPPTNNIVSNNIASSKNVNAVESTFKTQAQEKVHEIVIEQISNSEEILETLSSHSDDACSSKYLLRPVFERVCRFGMRCVYGTCSSESHGSYIAFECKCDSGARGLFCEDRCCLDCGDNGKCDIDPEGTPFCFCKPGYEGERCENQS